MSISSDMLRVLFCKSCALNRAKGHSMPHNSTRSACAMTNRNAAKQVNCTNNLKRHKIRANCVSVAALLNMRKGFSERSQSLSLRVSGAVAWQPQTLCCAKKSTDGFFASWQSLISKTATAWRILYFW